MKRSHPTGPSPKLSESLARGDRATVFVQNLTCRHSDPLDIALLVERHGPEFTYADLRARLRCTKCGGREVQTIISPVMSIIYGIRSRSYDVPQSDLAGIGRPADKRALNGLSCEPQCGRSAEDKMPRRKQRQIPDSPLVRAQLGISPFADFTALRRPLPKRPEEPQSPGLLGSQEKFQKATKDWLEWHREFLRRVKLLFELYGIAWKGEESDWRLLCLCLASDHVTGLRLGGAPGAPRTVESDERRAARRELLALVEAHVGGRRSRGVPERLLESLAGRRKSELPLPYRTLRCGKHMLKKELVRARRERAETTARKQVSDLMGQATEGRGGLLGGLYALGVAVERGALAPDQPPIAPRRNEQSA